jgi:membrane protein insertase Oxa1/YidC/SpoIIIJ
LVLYWLTNNVLTITQQVLTDRYFSGRWHLPGMDADDEKSSEPEEPKSGSKKKKDQAQ